MRVWKETISPKLVHDTLGVYHGLWMPDMDRCWESDDGYCVMSRLLQTAWGNVEHVTIQNHTHGITCNGQSDIPWAIKQEIKNELFGEKRLAIEVYPKAKNLIDATDTYHLWVFPKDFDLPFGIHPRDTQCKCVNRGCSINLNNVNQVKGENT